MYHLNLEWLKDVQHVEVIHQACPDPDLDLTSLRLGEAVTTLSGWKTRSTWRPPISPARSRISCKTEATVTIRSTTFTA